MITYNKIQINTNRSEEAKRYEKESNLKPFVVVREILSRRKGCS